MAIQNLKELIAALNDPAVTTAPRTVVSGATSLRVNPLAQTLTNIDTFSGTTITPPPVTVIDSSSTAVRTVEAGQSVVLVTGPPGPAGPPGAPGTLGADGRNGIDGVGVADIAISAGGECRRRFVGGDRGLGLLFGARRHGDLGPDKELAAAGRTTRLTGARPTPLMAAAVKP